MTETTTNTVTMYVGAEYIRDYWMPVTPDAFGAQGLELPTTVEEAKAYADDWECEQFVFKGHLYVWRKGEEARDGSFPNGEFVEDDPFLTCYCGNDHLAVTVASGQCDYSLYF